MDKKVIIPDELYNKFFKCDLQICKGACCTNPNGLGAPLKIEEIKIINDILPFIKEELSRNSIDFIEHNNFFEKTHGSFSTKCFKSGECVFAVIENGIAKCGIEISFLKNKINFRKPISCALFPVRLKNFGTEIELEYFDECSSALENGKKENIKLNNFLNESLNMAFDNKWNLIESNTKNKHK